MYKDKLITFAKNPSKNTIDHEAFHAYFDIALGKQEKNSFLGLVQKRQNLASKIDAEEWMADTFADFVAGREAQTGITGRIKTLFQDLAYRFKNFFGKEDKVKGLFRELEAIGQGKKPLKLTNDGGTNAWKRYLRSWDDFVETSAKKLKSSARYKVAGDTPLKPSKSLAGGKIDESFRKISERQFKKLQSAMENKEFYWIKSIPPARLLQDLKLQWFQEKITEQRISSDWVKHILNEHWVQSSDKIPVTMEDIRHIPEIQQNYDNVRLSNHKNTQWQSVIIYEKKIGNYYYYLERVTEKWLLDTQTMYIRETRKKGF